MAEAASAPELGLGRLWNEIGDLGLQRYIEAPAAAAFFIGGGKSRIGFDPVGGGGAETRLRGGHLQTIFLSKWHVKPHLVIGDVSAWHRCPSLKRRRT